MSPARKITAIIPVKNEGQTIENVIKQVPRDWVSETLVVDGHSTDDTVEKAKKAGAVVVAEEGRGYGDAVQTGVRHATGDYIVLLDGDGAYDVSTIPKLYGKIQEGFDVVFSSRYVSGSGSDDDTPVTLFGNKLFTYLLNVFHGVRISDSLFLYIMARKDVFKKIQMKSRHFEYCMEFPIRIHKAGLKYTEIASRESKRLAGSSKVNILVDGLKILGVLLRG